MKRTIRLVFGLILFALGIVLSVQANVGLSPWDAFSMGLSKLTRFSFGNIVIISSFAIIAIDVAFKEKIGFGTILNAVLIGKFVDLIQLAGIIPLMTNVWCGILMILSGLFVICIGSYFYIGASLGCGPRDSLMAALGKHFPKVPIGAIRALIEGTVLILGWLSGAKIGVGTVISVFGIGFILQFTFVLLHFDIKSIKHESVMDTVKAWRAPRAPGFRSFDK